MIFKLFKPDNHLTKDTMIFPSGMSRSGTTLLATVLDSHSQVSLGYELIPPKLPAPMQLKRIVEECLILCNNDMDKCGAELRSTGRKDVGLFVIRAFRAGLSSEDLVAILNELKAEGLKDISSFPQRLEVAWRIAKRKKEKEGTPVYGFKLNSPSVDEAFHLFPNGYFIYILRDPRDVVASHIKRGFDRTVREICAAWVNYIKSFEKFNTAHPDRSLIIRYEDLVSKPDKTINEIFEKLPLELEPQVFRFYDSKASVHKGGHPNSENLKKDFFTSSIGRGGSELTREVTAEIDKLCKEKMDKYFYE